jgi:ATP-dependent RNA helicase DOB1
VISSPTYCLPFLQPGRLVKIEQQSENGTILDFGWGVIVNFNKVVLKNKKKELLSNDQPEQPLFVADVLLHCAPGSGEKDSIPLPSQGIDGEPLLIPCGLESIANLSTVRLRVPSEIKSKGSRDKIMRNLLEVNNRFKEGLPLLDPIKDMQIKDSSFVKLMSKIKVLEGRKVESKLYSHPNQKELYELYESKVGNALKIKDLKKQATQAESVLQMDELKCRLRLLRRLGYTNESDVIEMKGRVACEISAGDEIVLTEMIFNGVFSTLTVEQTNALLSCFTTSERSDKVSLTPELSEPYRILKETAQKVATVSEECKIAIDPAEYLNSFRSELMPAVYAWSLGAKFSQVCKLTDIFEGSIIRSIKRQEELLRQLIDASKAIGNIELEEKFTLCVAAIKRDIVFANSLYL